MRCWNVALVGSFVLSAVPSSAGAAGLLVPTEPGIPPLSIVYQRVNVEITDQAARTRIEEEFRNPTARPLEAYYLFPVPRGAAVRELALWMNGKRTSAELVEANQARRIYEDIVRRTRDPGLLEHMGEGLYRVRVFPVPANGRQKVEVAYSEIVPMDGGIRQYVYPLKLSNDSARTEEDFTIRLEIHSSKALKSVYSPSHSVGVRREGDRKAIVGFEERSYRLDRDFHLYWTHSERDVGLSLLTYRESPGDDGYFLALISPKVDAPADALAPRDVVFVLDTSGSMQGEKIQQAKKSLDFCLRSLGPKDRFNLVGFATTTNVFERSLSPATKENIAKGVKWVAELEAVGGTAISDALDAALALRADPARNFTIVFLTDGMPTVGVTDPGTIVASVAKKNTAETRIFVFGVGDDVNAHLLDDIAQRTRATSVYVRPGEDLEAKVSGFYAKISRPVLSGLSIEPGGSSIRFKEMYPPELADLFHGGQILAVGRFTGAGAAAIKLKGKLGAEEMEFVYEETFPKEKRDADFLPALWARRKVGYLLDQIRLQGENKELVDEVTRLAKKFGIVTPYTSYLAAPDVPPVTPPVRPGPPVPLPRPREGRFGATFGQMPLTDGNHVKDVPFGLQPHSAAAKARRDESLRRLQLNSGEEAVDTAQALSQLKLADQDMVGDVRTIGEKTFVNYAGIWVDHAYDAEKHKDLFSIQYLSKAYFQLIEKDPRHKEILALGERVVWISPTGRAIAIDSKGKETLTEKEFSNLFGS